MRINMSKEKPMGIAAKGPQVRYSAAYPTGRERIVKGLLSHGGCPHSIPKGTSLPRGLIPEYSLLRRFGDISYGIIIENR